MATNPFVGEIRIFAGNFPPRGWAYCDGQLLAVSSNDALFSLLGTTFGGDGRTTFGLPDMRGRVPMSHGSGPGLTPRRQGQRSGSESVVLTTSQIPNHTHNAQASAPGGTQPGPENGVWATSGLNQFVNGKAADKAMNAGLILNDGGSRSHDNMMPYLAVSFIISLVGTYPSRQ